MIAKILINTSVKSLNKVYDYKIPDELLDKVQIGKRVEVNFGKSRTDNEEGIIVKIIQDSEYSGKYKLKEIISILDEISYIDEKRLKFAKYISYLYFCNVYDALKLMLPPGTKSKSSSKSINTKQDTIIKLKKSEMEIMQDIESNVITSPKHIRLLRFLFENDYVLQSDITDGLGISSAVINTVIKNGYIEKEKVDKKVDLLNEMQVERTNNLPPTDEQREAIRKINSYIFDEVYKECLLFGVTGSGKTEVYLQVIQSVINQGRKVVVLVPEISLTYQTVTRFISRFGNNIAVLHSKMTVAKRKEEYKRIKKGEVDIVIGARSAIFSPIENIGLVIIDEEHDSSYYSQTTPKYSTKEIARYICKENNAVLLLGSATPEISTFYKAKNGSIELIEMKKRPAGAILPDINLVDMKEERLLGNTSIVSRELKQEILKNIENKEQTMIFLNRRGYTSYLSCMDCSYIFKCPNCDVALTYHKNSDLLLCHYCSHVERNVVECPKCGGNKLSSSSIGTQKLEEELKSIYPNITTLRMDADTTVARDSHQKILDKFKNENIDVLIGTQMISKGHDIENVTLVGVLGVDAMLAINDYTATEKTYSNISQVAGRAGRGKKEGRVYIQTNDVSNYILDSVVNGDYEYFYNKEIEYRKIFSYPPFIDILMFEFVGRNMNEVKIEAQKLHQILQRDRVAEYKVFSPKAPYIQKINNKYRINVVLKTVLSTSTYKNIYSKLEEYNGVKKNNISMTVVKNPLFIS